MKAPHVSVTELYEIYRRHPIVRIDSRKVGAGDLFLALKGERVDGNAYAASALKKGAAYAIVDDPQVVVSGDDRYVLVEDSLRAIQQLANLHRRQLKMPVLAITGSNGKTTTKELVAAVMSKQYTVHATPGNYNNHLGLPLTILSMTGRTEMLILEMGANHQGEIAALCEIGMPSHGLITNIGDAHLEGFGGREGVIQGKGELYDFLAQHGGVAFFNQDEEELPEMVKKVSRAIPYMTSESPSPSVPGLEIQTIAVHPHIKVGFLSEGGELIESASNLFGYHNLQNVKTAIAVGKYFKVPGRLIDQALRDYTPDNHRSQWIEHRGAMFCWDAYNANPSSMEAALAGFSAVGSPDDRVAILGEMLELGESSPAAHRAVVLRAGQTARTVLLVGEEMKEVASEFERPYFENVDALREWFWQHDWSGKKIFVKGSRGNQLERLLEGQEAN